MINLQKANIDIEKAVKEHYDFFGCYVKKKLGINLKDALCKKQGKRVSRRSNTSKPSDFRKFKEFIEGQADLLKKIILGTPKDLIETHKTFEGFINGLSNGMTFLQYLESDDKTKGQAKRIQNLVDDITHIFNYDFLCGQEPYDEYSAYHLAENLGVRSCTYCNRVYTLTRTLGKGREKLMRPQFDHWFPQSKFPLLGVSFYNLIPCCSQCNSSVKRDLIFSITDHTHPYVEEPGDDNFVLDYEYDKSIEDYRILIEPKDPDLPLKAVNTLKKLKIDEMYNGHIPELKDLLKIKKAYGPSYLKQIADFFPDKGLSKKEVYRLFFGTEWDETNYHKRPMSRFKRDILEKNDYS